LKSGANSGAKSARDLCSTESALWAKEKEEREAERTTAAVEAAGQAEKDDDDGVDYSQFGDPYRHTHHNLDTKGESSWSSTPWDLPSSKPWDLLSSPPKSPLSPVSPSSPFLKPPSQEVVDFNNRIAELGASQKRRSEMHHGITRVSE
jgi:hypothetical protein